MIPGRLRSFSGFFVQNCQFVGKNAVKISKVLVLQGVCITFVVIQWF